MPVWPGDSRPEFREVKSLAEDGYVVQSIHFSNHLGTHLDAPSHIVKGGMTLDRIPLATLIGKAVLIDFSYKGKKDRITRKDLQAHGNMLTKGARVLVRTGWDSQYGSPLFFQDFPCLTLEAAQELAERGIALLGMDTPSPSPVDDPEQGIHKTLLDAGIVLLECLTNLHRIRGNPFELIVLPPLFKGFSGGPCRAVAVEGNFSGAAVEEAGQDRPNPR
jgi:kynurenine formamidase